VNGSYGRECRDVRRLVSLALDGELDALERVRLERHLRGCALCRQRAAEMEAITYTLRNTVLEPPSLSIRPRRRLRWRPLHALTVAATLLVVALGPGLLGYSAGGSDLRAPVTNAAPQQARISYVPQPQPQAPVYADECLPT
jgi:anti-sigma factor RsiW